MWKIGIGLDERQKQLQGKACQWGMAAGLAMGFLLFLLTQVIGVAISAKTLFAASLLAPIMTCCLAAMRWHALESEGSNVVSFGMSLVGAGGVYLLVEAVLRMQWEHAGLLTGSMVNDFAGMVLTGICLAALCGCYWGHRLAARREEKEAQKKPAPERRGQK